MDLNTTAGQGQQQPTPPGPAGLQPAAAAAWYIVLQHSSAGSNLKTVCSLLRVSKQLRVVVFRACVGQLAVALPPSAGRTQVERLAAWLAKHACLLKSLALNWMSYQDKELSGCQANSIALGLQQAAAAAAGAPHSQQSQLPLQSYSSAKPGGFASGLLQALSPTHFAHLALVVSQQDLDKLPAPGSPAAAAAAALAGLTSLRSLSLTAAAGASFAGPDAQAGPDAVEHGQPVPDTSSAAPTLLMAAVRALPSLTSLQLHGVVEGSALQCLPQQLQDLQITSTQKELKLQRDDILGLDESGAAAGSAASGSSLGLLGTQLGTQLSHLTALTKLDGAADIIVNRGDQLPPRLQVLRVRCCELVQPLLALAQLQTLAATVATQEAANLLLLLSNASGRTRSSSSAPRLPALREVQLGYVQDFTVETAADAWPSIPLSRLSIDFEVTRKLPYAHVYAIGLSQDTVQRMASLQQLTHLKLLDCLSRGSGTVRQLCSVLRHLTALQQLELQESTRSRSSVARKRIDCKLLFNEALVHLPHLVGLSLNLEVLNVVQLPVISQLTRLQLGGLCYINDAKLCSLVFRLPGLRELLLDEAGTETAEEEEGEYGDYDPPAPRNHVTEGVLATINHALPQLESLYLYCPEYHSMDQDLVHRQGVRVTSLAEMRGQLNQKLTAPGWRM